LQIAEPLLIAIEELSKLPGIGKKTAQRLALHLLKTEKENVDSLVKSIEELKTKNIHSVIGIIALPNKESVKLHEKFGFKKTSPEAEGMYIRK